MHPWDETFLTFEYKYDIFNKKERSIKRLRRIRRPAVESKTT